MNSDALDWIHKANTNTTHHILIVNASFTTLFHYFRLYDYELRKFSPNWSVWLVVHPNKINTYSLKNYFRNGDRIFVFFGRCCGKMHSVPFNQVS